MVTAPDTSPPEEEFVTTSKAGQLLGVSKRTIHYWLERGVLTSWATAGGHRRIPMSAIQEILDKRQLELHPSDQKAITLLLVEDDTDQLILFRKVVTDWPFPVRLVTADNGFDGLIQAGLYKPKVIVADLMMPAMDGFQMIRRLREHPDLADSLILVTTALDDAQITSRGGVPGDVLVFHKPTPFAVIRGHVARIAGHGDEATATP